MRTYEIAAAVTSLGLLSACGDQNDARPRDVTDAGEPVGQVGTLTDVPTDHGGAMQDNATPAPSGARSTDPESQRQNPPRSTEKPRTTSPGAAEPEGSPSQTQ